MTFAIEIIHSLDYVGFNQNVYCNFTGNSLYDKKKTKLMNVFFHHYIQYFTSWISIICFQLCVEKSLNENVEKLVLQFSIPLHVYTLKPSFSISQLVV